MVSPWYDLYGWLGIKHQVSSCPSNVQLKYTIVIPVSSKSCGESVHEPSHHNSTKLLTVDCMSRSQGCSAVCVTVSAIISALNGVNFRSVWRKMAMFQAFYQTGLMKLSIFPDHRGKQRETATTVVVVWKIIGKTALNVKGMHLKRMAGNCNWSSSQSKLSVYDDRKQFSVGVENDWC